MSYLSQKKYKVRENIFFICVSAIMLMMSGCLFFNPEFVFCGLNLFHFYCLGWLFCLMAVIARKGLYVVLLGASLLINYVLLAISGNIFFSDKIADGYSVDIEFGDNKKLSARALSKGILVAEQKEFASYEIINENAPVMLVRVDFREIDPKKHAGLLKKLHRFIVKQNIEIIVYGNFEMPSWSKHFRKFTEATGLSVKNKFIFDGFFSVPKFYILGYSNVGIKDLKISDEKIKAEISYDIL